MGFTIIGGGNGGGSPLSVESGDSTFENVNTLVLPEGFATESEAGVVELLASVAANPSGGLPLAMFAPNLVHKWSLEESGGPMTDSIGEADLIVVGSPTFEVEGVEGNQIQITGTSQYLEVDAGDLDCLDSFTLRLFYEQQDANADRAIWGINKTTAGKWSLAFDNHLLLGFRFRNAADDALNAAVTVAQSSANGRLQAIHLRYDAFVGQITVFVDGVAVMSSAVASVYSPFIEGDKWRFGNLIQAGTNTQRHGLAKFDEICLWNAALPPRAIKEDYETFFPPE